MVDLQIPEPNEIVVVKVVKILDYGAFAELIEYPGIQGFVHISQVASSWVKNIRNFVKENQVRVAQVTNIDHRKEQIDLSFNKVNPTTQRLKIEEYKQTKRSQKLLELVARERKVPVEETVEGIEKPLLDKYDSLYEAFQAILVEGDSAAPGVDKKWLPALKAIIEKNVETPIRTVKGRLSLSSTRPEGMLDIKHALVAAKGGKHALGVSMVYLGSNKWMVKTSSTDYKQAERALKEVADVAISLVEKAKGTGAFEKME